MDRDQESNRPLKPFKRKVMLRGVIHDVWIGPCACGAWHEGAVDPVFFEHLEAQFFKEIIPE